MQNQRKITSLEAKVRDCEQTIADARKNLSVAMKNLIAARSEGVQDEHLAVSPAATATASLKPAAGRDVAKTTSRKGTPTRARPTRKCAQKKQGAVAVADDVGGSASMESSSGLTAPLPPPHISSTL